MREPSGESRRRGCLSGPGAQNDAGTSGGELSARTGVFKLAAASLVCAVLTGCSMTRTAALQPEERLVTGSVAKSLKVEGLDPADAELIKSAVAQAELEGEADNALAWSNPDTGARGTIMAIDKFVGSHGQKCKKFQTTVDSFMGVSLYNGETCELKKGFWVLSWFLRNQ